MILDRDFNAQQGLTADRIAADALDFVGPCGTPDNGFRISLPGARSRPRRRSGARRSSRSDQPAGRRRAAPAIS